MVKLEDQLVTDLIKLRINYQRNWQGLKGHSFDDMAAFGDLLGEKYGLQKGGKKGNITIYQVVTASAACKSRCITDYFGIWCGIANCQKLNR